MVTVGKYNRAGDRHTEFVCRIFILTYSLESTENSRC